MYAQEKWKLEYREYKIDSIYGLSNSKRNRRAIMIMVRREAALERKLEEAQRKIEALQDCVWQLEAQDHNSDDGDEWEKEYYLRGMHRP